MKRLDLAVVVLCGLRVVACGGDDGAAKGTETDTDTDGDTDPGTDSTTQSATSTDPGTSTTSDDATGAATTDGSDTTGSTGTVETGTETRGDTETQTGTGGGACGEIEEVASCGRAEGCIWAGNPNNGECIEEDPAVCETLPMQLCNQLQFCLWDNQAQTCNPS